MSTVVHRDKLARVCIYCTGVAKSGCNALLQPPPNIEDESPSDIDNEANVNIGIDELLVGQELL